VRGYVPFALADDAVVSFHLRDIEIIRVNERACGAKCSEVVKEIAGTRSDARASW